MGDFPEYIHCSYRGKRLSTINQGTPSYYTYHFLDSGAYGKAYVDERNNRVLKIIEITENSTKEKCMDELEKQYRASNVGLAPAIYNYGSNDERNIRSDFTFPFFFIEMEYLSAQNGWIHTNQLDDDITANMCAFVTEFVMKTQMYNREDPWAHFYYNTRTGQIKMIDYGKVEYCPANQQETCRNEMLNQLGIAKACGLMQGGAKRKRSIKRRSVKRRSLKKRSIKKRSLKKRSIKKRSLKKRSVKKRSVKKRSIKRRGGNMPITLEEKKRLFSKFSEQQDKIEEALKNNQKRLQPIIDLYEIIIENPHIFLASNKFRNVVFEKMTAIEKNKDIYADDAGNENVLHHFNKVNTELKKLVNQYNKIYDENKMDLFQL